MATDVECPSCGAMYTIGTTKCPRCGQPAPGLASAPLKSQRFGTTLGIWLYVGLFAIGLAIAVYLITR